jgi:hypothetical protein
MDTLQFVAERAGERFEIIEGRGEGYYVLRYIDGRNTHDYLAPSVSGARLTAESEWGLSPAAWRAASPGELPLWQQQQSMAERLSAALELPPTWKRTP